MISRYLEDFAVGQTYGSGRARIEGDRIKSFATEFDPQPFHLDDDAARNSIFRGLAASGWHTAALTMRLLVQGVGARFTHHYDRPWRSDEPRAGRLVVIGQKGIDRGAITAALTG